MSQPRLFSSWLGATQIRDPATPRALGYVRRMMLNMDPPEHSRLRRLLARSFTPRAVARLEERIRGHARSLCDARRWPASAANATSPRTSPPTCRCSRWPTCSACPSRTAGCCSTGPTA